MAFLIEKENAKLPSELEVPSAIFVKCDVTDASKPFHASLKDNNN